MLKKITTLLILTFLSLIGFSKEIDVDNLNDSGAGSLREAVDLAVNGDTIWIDVTGSIEQFTADDGSVVEMVMPGDRIKMTAELIYPVAIEEGMRFAIREGGRTIGAGVVSKIVK